MTMAFLQRSCRLHRQLLQSRLLKPTSCSSYYYGGLGPAILLDQRCTIPRRCFATATSRDRRRKRPSYGIAKIEGNGPPKILPEITGLTQPFAYGGADGESTDDYLKKTSLSPWVPIPDPIARKLFDMSAPTPDDIHVELGCGDGRVNFYAIDHGKVKKSTGIDIDDGILKQARERLMKRHPQPPIEFLTADLLDYRNEQVWGKIQEATILTMYFVKDALVKLRPLLEETLAGKRCKIITCAYAMPGWNPFMIETTLGTTCYLYNWGSMEDDEMTIFADDSLLIGGNKPKELLEDPLDRMKAQGLDMQKIERVVRKVPDRSVRDPNDYWTDDEEEEELESEDVSGPPKAKKPPCS